MVKDSSRSGAGENKIYKPIWFAYDALDSFLSDGLTPTTIINTQPSVSIKVGAKVLKRPTPHCKFGTA